MRLAPLNPSYRVPSAVTATAAPPATQGAQRRNGPGSAVGSAAVGSVTGPTGPGSRAASRALR